MSRRTSRNEYRRSQWFIAAVYLALVGALTIASASADEGLRSSKSQQYKEADGGQAAIETADSYAALSTDGPRTRSRSKSRASSESATADAGASPKIAQAVANDFWIFDADVVLFGDDDVDGYFFGIDLLFDADTVYSSAPVYAVLYLSLDGGPWNEYAATEDFLIEGANADDEYVVVTELQSGYPTGDYDLLIELFDADTGEFLTDFGPEGSSSLSLLPLEDFNRDAPVFDTPVTVTRVRGGGGGSMAVWLLALLTLTTAVRHARRRSAVLERAE